MIPKKLQVTLLLLTFVVLVIQAQIATAENFRIDNVVYADQQTAPTSESSTIFHDGMVYDCMKTPAEIVVFDKSAGQFTLLNVDRRTRAELSTAQITAFVDQLQPRAAKSRDPLARFLAEPKFQESSEDDGKTLILGSPEVAYRLTLVAEQDPSIITQYHEFSDWCARLNAMLSPGALPPFGRLIVNAALAQRNALPSQVVLTLPPGKPRNRPTTIRTVHHLVRPLEAVDLERIARAREAMKLYKLVSFEQYRKDEPR